MISPRPGRHDGHSPREYSVVETTLASPPLPGKVAVAGDADRIIDMIAADLVIHAVNCVRNFGDFHLALSGGSSPVPLYERLMYDPDFRKLPWRKTHLWIVDERRVPFNDERSNFGMISETIVDHADIPPEQVHPIYATSETADIEYENTLREQLVWREKGQDRLDCVLLGIGADGHTASLFAHDATLGEDQRFVRIADGPLVTPPERVTMTYPLINAARLVTVLVTGKDKAEAIARVAGGEETAETLPIMGIEPLAGTLRWYLDADAAGGR